MQRPLACEGPPYILHVGAFLAFSMVVVTRVGIIRLVPASIGE